MKLFGNTVVPVLNRTIWMFLLVVLLVENIYLYVTKPVSVEEPTLVDVTAKIVKLNYPNLICSAEDNEGFKEYIHGFYGVTPDHYEKNHFIVYGKDKDGTMLVKDTFSLSRCEIKDDLSEYTKKVVSK